MSKVKHLGKVPKDLSFSMIWLHSSHAHHFVDYLLSFPIRRFDTISYMATAQPILKNNQLN